MENNDGKKTNGNEKDFGFPLNIKQMGNVDKDLKIYIEDYVYTYLYRYARTRGKSEKLAVLVGRFYRVDGQDTVVISGAIEGRYTVKENGNEIFTDETWNFVSEQREKFFSELSVVGWVRVQPEYGTLMMAKDESFHKECFKNKWQVFFVIDPAEMHDSAYVLTESKGSMRKVKGYFIYYDKNENMQDYMIENNISQPKDKAEYEKDDIECTTSGKAALYRLLGMKERDRKTEKYVPDRIDAAAKIRSVLKEKEQTKKEKYNRGYAVTAVCAVLSLVCLATSMAMIKERNKIKVLESEILNIKTSYTAMAERFEETVQVFAVQKEKVEEEKEMEAVEDKAENKKYTIEEGDSLWYICRTFYNGENKIEEIMTLNNIENENILYVGQVLELP